MLKTLKKIAAGIVLTVMAFIGLTLVTVLPAQAGEPEKQVICHATASETNPFVKQTVDEAAIVKGGHGASGINADDIIPPFDYNFGGSDYGTYPGQNWTDENQGLWSKDCNAANNVLTPVLPVPPVQTCANPNPTFTVPAQPDGITATSTPNANGTYTVTYQLPANTVYNTYAFPEGFVNPVTVSTVDNRPLDEFWDATKGECNLPNMGAGSIKSEHILWAGGLIFAGLLLTTVARIGRRNA